MLPQSKRRHRKTPWHASFYLNGVRSSTKDPTSFFLYKEILAKMLTALIKGTEKREQYNNRAIDSSEMKTPGERRSGNNRSVEQ